MNAKLGCNAPNNESAFSQGFVRARLQRANRRRIVTLTATEQQGKVDLVAHDRGSSVIMCIMYRIQIDRGLEEGQKTACVKFRFWSNGVMKEVLGGVG